MIDRYHPDGSDTDGPGVETTGGYRTTAVTPAGTRTISGPQQTVRPAPQERANELVEEYLVAAAEDARKVAAAIPPPAAVNWRLFLAGFMVLGCVAVWTVVLFTRSPKIPVRLACREARQAALKVRVARQAEFVNDYVRQKGRLPPFLDSAQDALLGVAYFNKPDGTYELVGTDRELVSNYRSTWALDSFVGDAPHVVARRCR